jgi:hypothetical protein
MAMRIYRQMYDNEAIIGAGFNLIKSTIRQVKWKVVEADGTPESIREKEFLEECLDDMEHTWPDFMGEVLSFMPFGWSLFEKGIKYRLGRNPSDSASSSRFDDGRIGWRGFFIRPQESLLDWEFDDEGQMIGMWQRLPKGRAFIPISKTILFRTENNKGNPEGRAMLRNVYRSWYFKNRIEEIEAVGIEREFGGMIVIKLPTFMMDPKADASTKAARASYETMAQKLRNNEYGGLVFPTDEENGKKTGYAISTMQSGGTRSINVGETIRRLDRNIAMCFSTQFQLLGQDKSGGSRALSSDQTDMFGLSLGSVLDTIQDTFNRSAVHELYDLNGVPYEHRAYLVHGDIEKPEIDRLAITLKTLVDGGLMQPDNGLEDFIRDTLQLPMRSDVDDEDVTEESPLDPEEELDALSVPEPVRKYQKHQPTDAMAMSAQLAIQVRAKLPKSRRGMSTVELARIQDIAMGKSISGLTVERMVSFFARHTEEPSSGSKTWQRWAGYGGHAGKEWVNGIASKQKDA